MNSVNIGQNHPLCKALQNKGYSIRFSKEVVCAIFNEIKQSLINKESVELPIGVFTVEKETRNKQRRIGLRGPETVYKRPWKVRFKYNNE